MDKSSNSCCLSEPRLSKDSLNDNIYAIVDCDCLLAHGVFGTNCPNFLNIRFTLYIQFASNSHIQNSNHIIFKVTVGNQNLYSSY